MTQEAPTATLPAVMKAEERQLIKAGAQKWSKAEVLALKELCCPKDATPSEILSFWYVAKRTGLDPFARQLYLVRYGKGDEQDDGRGRCTIQIGIDGFRQVSMDTPGFAGVDEPKFDGEGEEEGIGGKIKHPIICRVTVHRMLEGQRVAFVGMARWAEFAKRVNDKQTNKRRLNSMWSSMPYNQLAKCAEAQAHRKSAPMRLAGVYAPEEIGTIIDVVGTPVGMPQALPGLRSAASTPNGKADGGALAPNKQLWNALMDHVGGNQEEAANLLEKLTAFQGSKGPVKGVRDWSKLSDAWAAKTLERFEESIKR